MPEDEHVGTGEAGVGIAAGLPPLGGAGLVDDGERQPPTSARATSGSRRRSSRPSLLPWTPISLPPPARAVVARERRSSRASSRKGSTQSPAWTTTSAAVDLVPDLPGQVPGAARNVRVGEQQQPHPADSRWAGAELWSRGGGGKARITSLG